MTHVHPSATPCSTSDGRGAPEARHAVRAPTTRAALASLAFVAITTLPLASCQTRAHNAPPNATRRKATRPSTPQCADGEPRTG